MYHIICVGGETQMLTYAGSSVTGCASQHLSWLYSTFNFVSHFGADVAAELELLPADRRIGCSVRRGASSLSLTSEKTFASRRCHNAASWRSLDSCRRSDDCVGPVHVTQNRETYSRVKNLPHCSRRLSSLSLHSFVYLTQAHTDTTHFNHGETWQQMSASILNLINGNDSSVIHLSKVAFSAPLPPHSRKGWTQFGERPSLLLLTKRRPGAWGKHFLSEIRQPGPFIFIYLFLDNQNPFFGIRTPFFLFCHFLPISLTPTPQKVENCLSKIPKKKMNCCCEAFWGNAWSLWKGNILKFSHSKKN